MVQAISGEGMKIVGMMLARNEQWVVRASLAVALEWCDVVLVTLHACTDHTREMVRNMRAKLSEPARVVIMTETGIGHWDEMNMRERMLRRAEELGATHYGLVDADEIPTANITLNLPDWCDALQPGQVLELPMIPAWRSLDQYRDDNSVWSSAFLSVAVAHIPGLTFKPHSDGYQHHNRIPQGAKGSVRPIKNKRKGGAFHLQFANWPRLLSKHVLYRMSELIRWPERESSQQLNAKYDQALDERGLRTTRCPPEWWSGREWHKRMIDLEDQPYQDRMIFDLLHEHGVERFEGLDLKGYVEKCRSLPTRAP